MKLCLNMVFFDMPANETEVNGKNYVQSWKKDI